MYSSGQVPVWIQFNITVDQPADRHGTAQLLGVNVRLSVFTETPCAECVREDHVYFKASFF